MAIFRMQLKPRPEGKISFKDILNFCKKNHIIGIGWCGIRQAQDTPESYAQRNHPTDTKGLSTIRALAKVQQGDLIWTRLGGDANQYYLCKVNRVWKDCLPTEEMKKYDIGNFVSVTWAHIGTLDYVPGKIINSFCAQRAIQHVNEVDTISKYIWNQNCPDKQEQYTIPTLSTEDFWNSINSEELECLVLLFLQYKGYFIYSSTLKISTAKYETVMIYKDGSHKALPQVKRNQTLDVKNYIQDANEQNRVYLFTTSENYGKDTHPYVYCIKKAELIRFIKEQAVLLPPNIQYWTHMLQKEKTINKY